MAIDLAKDPIFLVTIVDKNKQCLNKIRDELKIKKMHLDATSEELKEELKNYDIVLNVLPGFIGFKVLKSIIEAGKNVVDISFFPEDSFELDELAKNKKVIQSCSMVRTTGYTPTMAVLLLLERLFTTCGISTPEFIGQKKLSGFCFGRI